MLQNFVDDGGDGKYDVDGNGDDDDTANDDGVVDDGDDSDSNKCGDTDCDAGEPDTQVPGLTLL